MPRKLKFHEQKLLKKVNFAVYKNDNTLREGQVMQRYHLDKREDYWIYNKLVGNMQSVCKKLVALDPKDPYRIKTTEQLLEKLYAMGIIPNKNSLEAVSKVNVSAFCRRRLPVVLFRLKFVESVKQGVQFVEQGHIRVGPNTMTDPAFLVTRNMEDFITWVDSSKIRRHVLKYNDALDDFDLLGA